MLSGLNSWRIGTATAPYARQAMKTTIQEEEFFPQMATLSPGVSPAAWKKDVDFLHVCCHFRIFIAQAPSEIGEGHKFPIVFDGRLDNPVE